MPPIPHLLLIHRVRLKATYVYKYEAQEATCTEHGVLRCTKDGCAYNRYSEQLGGGAPNVVRGGNKCG